jgi:hypothetical protein
LWPAALAAAASALVFARLRAPASSLLVFVPFAALVNLEAWVDLGPVYPSTAVLLAAVAVAALRRPSAFRLTGSVRLALAYGLWVTVAACSAAAWRPGAMHWTEISRLAQSGFLAAALAALGANLAAPRAGAARFTWAAAVAAGLLGALALGEATLGRAGGVPATGRVVGGSELLALHLTLLFPPGLALLAASGERRSGAERRALALLASLVFAGLLLSFSRSGWIGAWAAILGMGLIAIKTDRGAAVRLIALALVLAAAGGLAVVVLGGSGSPLASAYGDRLGSLAHGGLLADRRAEWGRGLAVIGAHPVLGDPQAPNPYNLALGVAATSGLPALVLFAGFVLASTWGGLVAAWRSDRGESIFAVGLLGAVIALLVTGIGEATLGTRLTPPAFATLGLLAGLGPGAAGDVRDRRAGPARSRR